MKDIRERLRGNYLVHQNKTMMVDFRRATKKRNHISRNSVMCGSSQVLQSMKGNTWHGSLTPLVWNKHFTWNMPSSTNNSWWISTTASLTASCPTDVMRMYQCTVSALCGEAIPANYLDQHSVTQHTLITASLTCHHLASGRKWFFTTQLHWKKNSQLKC